MGIIQPYIPHLPFELYYRNLNNIEILAYMKCLLNAIKTVHKIGFVHRDIKPANFIFLKEARTGYLIDFGLSEPIVQSGYYDVNSKSKTGKDKNKALPKTTGWLWSRLWKTDWDFFDRPRIGISRSPNFFKEALVFSKKCISEIKEKYW